MHYRVEILAANILHNYSHLEQLANGPKLAPVVKSNAYGHGIAEVISVIKSKKPPFFIVQTCDEAKVVNSLCDTPVLILGSATPHEITSDSLKNVVYSVGSLTHLQQLASLPAPIKIQLCLNTGMNREGINGHELEAATTILQNSPHLIYDGVWSHFADADGDTDTHRKQQEDRFSELLSQLENAGLQPTWVHIANSAGFLKTVDKRINLFRAGMAMYGFPPVKELAGVKPVLRLVARVAQVRAIAAGESVGYNCCFTADRPMTIGIVPVGYYEALSRRLSDKGHFIHMDKKTGEKTYLPILGRVSMNMTCFDTCGLPIDEGTEITVISDYTGDRNSIDSMAILAETIPDEIVTRLIAELPRVVV